MGRPLVLYHGNDCGDGLAAAALAYCHYGDGADYQPVQYGQPPPEVTGRDVLILDFSYPRAVLLAMHDAARSLVVLDHHKTAQADLDGLPFCRFDMNRSGATMTWDYLQEDGDLPPRLFAEYAEDRDLWRFKLPESRAVYTALAAEDPALGHRASIAREFHRWLPQLASDGRAMIRRDEAHVARMVRHARMQNVDGYEVPVVNATVLFSEVGDALCKAHPEAPFACYYFDDPSGMRQWGARSRGGFDVSKIAERFGGGGHPAAAGWREALA